MKIFLILLFVFNLYADTIKDISEKVSNLTGKTFVFSRDLNISAEIVTPDLSRVKNIKILKNILKDNGYNLVLDANGYYKLINKNKIYNYSVKVNNNIKDDFIKFFRFENIKYVYMENTNIIFYKCSYGQNLRVKKMLKKIDIKNTSVMLRFIIFSYNSNNLKDLGIDYRKLKFGSILQSFTSKIFNKTAIFNSNDFFSAINFLRTEGEVKVMQYPYIVVRNNKKFNFKNVQSIPIQKNSSVINANKQQETVNYEYIDVGLQIFGNIDAYEKYVALDLDFVIDSVVSGSENNLPILSKKSFNSLIDVSYDKVLLITGLKNNRIEKNDYSIPYLSNMPLLGGLFSYVIDSKIIEDYAIAIYVIKK